MLHAAPIVQVNEKKLSTARKVQELYAICVMNHVIFDVGSFMLHGPCHMYSFGIFKIAAKKVHIF